MTVFGGDSSEIFRADGSKGIDERLSDAFVAYHGAVGHADTKEFPSDPLAKVVVSYDFSVLILLDEFHFF